MAREESGIEKSRILVVEDESIVAMDIEEQLLGLGYQVSGLVASGEEAIQSATSQRPDLVLMDIMLEGEIDGIKAAETICNSMIKFFVLDNSH